MTGPLTKWGDKRYYALDTYLKERFGEKVYRLSLNAGLTCPNRDGTLGTEGCIFCSRGGSGDFAAPAGCSISQQIAAAKARISSKSSCRKFLAYFQAYTNTYGPIPYLRRIFMEALTPPEIVGLSIATRPDCLSAQVLDLLTELKKKPFDYEYSPAGSPLEAAVPQSVSKPLWIELGLQTMHEKTRRFLGSGFSLDCFETAVSHLKERKIPLIVHIILGLPGETEAQMLDTIDYLAALGIDGIKLQLLHILTDTRLYQIYKDDPFLLPTLDEYCSLLCKCIERLPPEVVIHRLTGDGPKKLLAAPTWSADKKRVLNAIHQTMRRQNSWQGKAYHENV